jgi:high affinity Mn2+ porin
MVAYRLALLVPLLVLICGGCATGQRLSLARDDGPGFAVVDLAAGSKQEVGEKKPYDSNGSEKSDKPVKSPGPRTAPQAFCSYLKRLCSPNESAENAKDPADATQKEKTAPPASGVEPKTNGKPEDAKAKADGESQKKANGENEKDQPEKEEKAAEPEESWYSAHAQSTVVIQKHGGFHAPYQGQNSLLEREPASTSATGTLFLDMRLWECCGSSTELVFNPEFSGGLGFSGVTGIAGFPNIEIVRVGVPEPTPYIARLFVRQIWGLGGEKEKAEDEPNQIAGQRDVDRITLTVGKFTMTDIADNNRYSHEGRTQFLPWSFAYNAAWDYPANVRGYNYGVGLEFNRKDWALRYAIMGEPTVANGKEIDPHFTEAFGQVVELEQRYQVCDRRGTVRYLAYLNRAHMGDYAEALAAMPVNPNVTATRDYRYKYGFGLSWDQELTKDLGIWSRLGWNDGHTESWAFTAIDRLFDVGLLLKGSCWCRPNDAVGLAFGINGLEGSHRAYLAAGGLDFIIGDGALNYAPEQILEAFYSLEVRKGIYVSADFQEVNHPAYNADRGPVSVMSMRVHFEF